MSAEGDGRDVRCGSRERAVFRGVAEAGGVTRVISVTFQFENVEIRVNFTEQGQSMSLTH